MAGTLTFKVGEVRSIYEHAKAAAEHTPNMSQIFDPRLHKDGVIRDEEGNALKLGRDGMPKDGWPSGKNIDKTKVPAGLWLVGDQGVYLMSNGAPAQLVAKGKDARVIAYAAECDPTSREFDDWYDAKQRIFGEDDGCEYLPLSMFEPVMSLPLPDDASISVKLTASRILVYSGLPKARIVIKDGMKIKLGKPINFKSPKEGCLQASLFRILDAKIGSAVALDMTQGGKPSADTRVKLSMTKLRDRIRSGEAEVIARQNDAAKVTEPEPKPKKPAAAPKVRS